MTGNNILLDTNVVIELFKGNPVITKLFESYTTVEIPFITVGELYFGAYRSANPAKHLTQVNSFLDSCAILPGDDDTANHYAAIKTALFKKGKPIPENDIWIAAIAMQYNLTLVTRDNHFDEVKGIATLYW